MSQLANPLAILRTLLVTLLASCAAVASGAADQVVTLPYQQPDKDGNTWIVHYYGYLQQQGNMPVYSSTGVLTINGNSTSGRMQRTAKIDGKTGELVIENLPVGQTTVTRRFWFNKEDGYVRMIDLIRNTAGRDQQLNIVLNANANYGVQNGATVADPKKKGQNFAFVAHVACAFHFFHGWSHADALRETARQTGEVTGTYTGAGLYLNYLFALAWSADVAWWWVAGLDRYDLLTRWVTVPLHSFLAFMAFNGTVVFEAGATRWVAAGVTGVLLVLLARRYGRGSRRLGQPA